MSQPAHARAALPRIALQAIAELTSKDGNSGSIMAPSRQVR